MKMVHHHTNGRFDWLISKHRSVNPSKEAISLLSDKYKGFAFVHPVQSQLKEDLDSDYEEQQFVITGDSFNACFFFCFCFVLFLFIYLFRLELFMRNSKVAPKCVLLC